ncbi:MAG: ATP-dependent Clp protease proteolytic subunit [Bacteroidales bacterium]|nr:ATP-dependent Clp protease proteolytic subunit [Bacteroidales bacterium]
MRNKFFFWFVIFLLSANSFFAQEKIVSETPLVYKFNIDEEIAPPVTRRMAKAWEDAIEKKADLILIHMNTYGGLVVDADTIRTRILNSKIPVVVFIDNNAASAGALISIACEKIYMRQSANIGAATVVNQTAEAMPDKYQSYMRATMRATAEARGRDPKIAEAMVDQDIYIPDISDSGKVLTFTASEALQHGYCDSIVESVDGAVRAYGFQDYKVEELKLTAVDKVIDFLISPMIHGLLIMIIIGGIYFELQSPGIGFPSAAALLAAILYFMPLYLEGLADNWEILVFFIGIALLIVEIFVIPGFGIAGISGLILMIGGLMFAMLNNVNFDFSNVPLIDIANSFIIVVLSILLSLFVVYFLAKGVFGTSNFSLALNTSQPHNQGYVATTFDLSLLHGKEGIAATMLRPSGKVEIDDDTYDALAKNSFIEKGEKIRVVKSSNTQLVVEKIS